MKNKTVQKMCICATMAAVAIVLDTISIKTEFTKFTFYAFPIIMSALCFDLKYGLLTGVVAGFISQVINYGISITTPLWMIPYLLWAILPYLFNKLFKAKNKISLFLIIFLTSIIITTVNSGILYIDGIIWDYPTQFTLAIIGTKIAFSLISCAIYFVLCSLLIDRIKNIVSKDSSISKN